MPAAPSACRRLLPRLSAFAIASFLWLPVPAAVYPGLNGGPGDLDGDGFVAAADCDDGDPSVWAVPGEVHDLLAAAGNPKRFVWDPVANTGGSGVSVTYEMLRSQTASNFLNAPTATCLDVGGLDLQTVDPAIPPPGGVFFYLVRARASCGSGGLGARSNGVTRAGRDCDCAQLCDDGNACTTDRCGNGACAHDSVAPVLLHGPASTSACNGGAARFDVVIRKSLGALHFAWRKNGLPIGTDSNSLVLTGLGPLDNGSQITVNVTDGCVTTTSPAAVLTVFADSASCAGGLNGEDAPNGAGALPMGMSSGRWLMQHGREVTVSLHSGELHYEAADLVLAGRGFDFVWARHYRSREWRSTPMGVGWRDSYDRRIEPDPAQPGHLLVHDGDSRIDSFGPALSGCHEAAGFFESLCPQPNGSRVLTFPDGSSWTFAALDGSLAQGRIVQSRDRYGNAMSFAYDGAGRLVTITDTLGRNVGVVYNSRGLIASVTDFAGRQVRYAYYNGVEPGGEIDDLKSVTSPAVTGTPTGNDFPQGKTEVYTYSQGSPIPELNHNLLSVTDGAGNTWLEAAYSTTQLHADPAFDRLYRFASHDGSTTAATKLSYVSEVPGSANGFAVTKTIVGDGVGNVGEYHFDALSRLVVVRDFTGRTPDPAVPTDDTFNRPGPPIRPTDPPFFETRYEYNADFLPTRVVLPNGNELLSTYDSSNPSKRKQGDMDMLRQLPGLLGGDQTEIVESWHYATSLGTDWSGRSDTAGGEGGGGAGGMLATRGKVKSVLNTGSGVTGGTDAVRGKVKDIKNSGMGVTGGTDAVRGKVKTVKDNGNGMTGGTDAVRGKVKNIKDTGMGRTGGSEAVRGKVKIVRDTGGGRVGRSLMTENDGGLGFPTSYTDGEGNTWTLTYDASGSLTDLTAPTVVTGTLGGVAQTIHDGWAHNAFGQIVRHTDPDGVVAGFDYYSSGPQTGYLQRAIVDPAGLALTTNFSHDPLGRVVQMTDPRGHATSLTLNALDQVVRVSESPDFPYETYFYYDAGDRNIRTDLRNVDETGALRSNPYLSRLYQYDGLDRLVRVTEETAPGLGLAEEYQRDANGNLSLWRKGAAVAGTQPTNVVAFLHDERDLVYRVVDAQGSPSDVATDQYDYDRNGNLVAERLGLEHPAGPNVTTWTHDGFDRPVRETDAEGNETTVHYDANGNPASLRLDGELTDGSGGPNVRLYESSFVHDEVDRLVRTEVAHFEVATGLPIGDGTSTSSTFFDPASRVARAEDDNGHGADYAYDSAGRLAGITDQSGNTVTGTLDADSNITSVTETEVSDLGGPPAAFTTHFEYDALGRQTAAVDGAGARREASYDSRDLLVRARDQLGNVARYAYYGLGRVVRTEKDLTDTGTGGGTVVSTQITTRAWDDSSRLASSTDPNGNTTTHAYDGHDHPVSTTFADGTSEATAWDSHHSPIYEDDANGSTVSALHDRLGRVISRSVSRAPGVQGTTSETFRYDGASRLVSAQDDDSADTYAHDSLSNVILETQRVGAGPARAVAATHDGKGNATSRTDSSGNTTTYAYDALDQVKLVLDGGVLVASYDYAGPHRLARVTRANGVETDYGYDAARRVTSVSDGGFVPLFGQTVSWGPACDSTTRTEPISDAIHEYAYDSLHRLVRSTRSPSGSPPEVVQYELDAAGNRVLVTGGADAGPYTMDVTLPEPADFQVGQYTTTPLGSRSYDRKGNGVLLDGGLSSTERILAYDYGDQVSSATRAGLTTTYAIDALGRRLAEAPTSGPALEWVWGGREPLEELSGGASRWAFTRGVRGELLRMREVADVNGDGVLETYFLHRDDLGNVVAVTSGSGAVVETYRYDDYGVPQVFDGSGTPLAASAIGNPFLFRGWRYDATTGLYESGTGGFDPESGRPARPSRRPLTKLVNWVADRIGSTSASPVLDNNPLVSEAPMSCETMAGPTGNGLAGGSPSNSFIPTRAYYCRWKTNLGSQTSSGLCCALYCDVCHMFLQYPCCEDVQKDCERNSGAFGRSRVLD